MKKLICHHCQSQTDLVDTTSIESPAEVWTLTLFVCPVCLSTFTVESGWNKVIQEMIEFNIHDTGKTERLE